MYTKRKKRERLIGNDTGFIYKIRGEGLLLMLQIMKLESTKH